MSGPTNLILAGDAIAALKLGASFDWKGMVAAMESGSTEQKIVNGLIAADDFAMLVGVFLPPVAVIATDVGVAITAEQAAEKIVRWVAAQPSTKSMWARVTTAFNRIF